MAPEHEQPTPPEPPLSPETDDLRSLLASLPENVASALSGAGKDLEFELRGMAEALGEARWHGAAGLPEPLAPAGDVPESPESLWGGPPVYLTPDPAEAGESLWSGQADFPAPGPWLDPPETPPPGQPARTITPDVPLPAAESPQRTITPDAGPWWQEGLGEPLESADAPWWREEAGQAERADAGLPPSGEGEGPASGELGALPDLPGVETGGGADILGFLERIVGLLERLVEAAQQRQEGIREGWEREQGLTAEPTRSYPLYDDGVTPASPSIDLGDLFRPGQTRDASSMPRREDPRNYYPEDAHP